jgi:hypothetical protein
MKSRVLDLLIPKWQVTAQPSLLPDIFSNSIWKLSNMSTTDSTPRPTPTVPNPTFSVSGHSIIDAPIEAVYDALLDLASYREWNTLVTNATVTKPAVGQTSTTRMQTGTHFDLRVKMNDKASLSTSKELCVLTEPVKTPSEADPTPTTTARWVMDAAGTFPLLSYLLQAEHVNELRDLGDGRTEYTHWESFGGVISHAVKWFAGEDLARHFESWPGDLKAYVEKKQSAVQN